MHMNIFHIAKIAAIILLLMAFALPLSRCSSDSDSNSSVESSKNYTYEYAWSDFNYMDISSWLILIVFFWPIPFVILEIVSKKEYCGILILSIEIILALGSIYMIYLRTFLDELWYGGYLSYASLAIILIVTAIELIRSIRHTARHRDLSRGS